MSAFPFLTLLSTSTLDTCNECSAWCRYCTVNRLSKPCAEPNWERYLHSCLSYSCSLISGLFVWFCTSHWNVSTWISREVGENLPQCMETGIRVFRDFYTDLWTVIFLKRLKSEGKCLILHSQILHMHTLREHPAAVSTECKAHNTMQL